MSLRICLEYHGMIAVQWMLRRLSLCGTATAACGVSRTLCGSKLLNLASSLRDANLLRTQQQGHGQRNTSTQLLFPAQERFKII